MHNVGSKIEQGLVHAFPITLEIPMTVVDQNVFLILIVLPPKLALIANVKTRVLELVVAMLYAKL